MIKATLHVSDVGKFTSNDHLRGFYIKVTSNKYQWGDKMDIKIVGTRHFTDQNVTQKARLMTKSRPKNLDF